MEVIDKGHFYRMHSLSPDPYSLLQGYRGVEFLQFVHRVGNGYPGNLGAPYAGTNIQDVCRCLIDRLFYLNGQIPYWSNRICIFLLRTVMNLLEWRAARRHGRRFRWRWRIETLPFDSTDGHIRY
jgi:hypothetical protein